MRKATRDDQIMVFDLAELEFVVRPTKTAVMTRSGVLVHLAQNPENPTNESAVASALASVVRSAVCPTSGGESLNVGLYDPFSNLLETSEGVYMARLEFDPGGAVIDVSELGEVLDRRDVAERLLDSSE